MKSKNNILQHLGFIALAFAAVGQSAQAGTTYTWNTNTSGALWSAPGSWVGAAVPTFVAGDTFDLSTRNITVNGTTSSMDTVGGNTLGTIKIGDSNNTNNWILALSTPLTLDGNGSAATINQVSTSKGDTISGAGGIILASDLNTTNASGNVLSISTGITASGGTRTITNDGSGSGRVNLNSAIGSGINLVQNSTTSATWMLGASASFDGTITVKAGSFEVGATTGSAISLGTAAFTLGDTSGSSDATLVFKSINGTGYSAPISVASGSAGIKSIFGAVNTGGNTNVLSSAITLGASSSATADVTIGNSTGSTSTYEVRSGFTGFGNVTVNTLSSGRTRFTLGSINNTGTLTNAGTGTGVAQIDEVIGTNITGVVQNSSTSAMNLNAANTYSGATTVSAGTLTLSNALALQNSALDTTNSIVGTSTAGLKTTVTTLTMGGLTGNKDLASVFTTTSGGYSAVSALTLNPGTGVTNAYTGVIANGAAGMTLTKTGSGTQTLSGANTYTGKTTISGGTLALGAGGSIANSSEIALNGGNFNVSAVAGYSTAASQALTGSGSITGDITVTGTLAIGNSPGTMTFNDDLTIGSSAISNFELTDIAFGSGSYDLAQGGVGTQTATFGGTLNLFFSGGSYVNNSSVQIFDFENYSADFTMVNFNGLGVGQSATFDSSTGFVTVIPEPGAALLGGLGMLALLRRRRN